MSVQLPKVEWAKQIHGVSSKFASRNISVERLDNGQVRIHIYAGLGPRASTKKSIAFVDLTEPQAAEVAEALEYAVHMDDGKVTEPADIVLDPSLMEMTVPELKNVASSQEVDIKGKNKVDIVLALMADSETQGD